MLTIHRKLWSLLSLNIAASLIHAAAQTVSGTVTDPLSIPLSGVRVTLYNADTTFFEEERTDALGAFTFAAVPAGAYTLNGSRRDRGYQRTPIVTNDVDPTVQDFTLEEDTVMGRWDVLVNSPEPLGGTNLCILLPDGRMFYCHNTTDPFVFDPSIDVASPIAGSGATQGCVGLAMRSDSTVVFIGGADQEVYGPGTQFVKTWNSSTGQWTAMEPVLSDHRWYPTTTTLPDGRVLTIGGGNENNPQRTNTSELLDPFAMTSTLVDTIAIGNEVSPIVMLYDGRILMTHRPPQLFDPNTAQWDPTGDFVQGPRMPNGDHADHELTLLPEGNAVAIGYKSFVPGDYGDMVEVYDPTTETWSLGANNLPVRSRTKSMLLPDKKILVLAGFKEDPMDPTPTNAWGYTNLCHVYDPYTDSWRHLSDMNYQREYHANAVIARDGRVIVVGGEGQPGNEPPLSVLEAFTPPYLFKGVRPSIGVLSDNDLVRGESISFTATRTDSLTEVILMSLPMVTHFMNCGNNRYVDLSFAQSGTQVTATLPTDVLALPNGFYQLIGMVDDIPSEAIIVRVNDDLSTGLEHQSATAPRLGIYPVPAMERATLMIGSGETVSSTLMIMDPSGRTMPDIPIRLSEGRNELQLDVTALAAGIYYVTILLPTGSASGKLIVAR